MRHLFFLFALLSFLNLRGQTQLSDVQLSEDYQILVNIICEVSPTLSDAQKDTLRNYLENRGKELNGQNFTAVEFFRFLMGSKPSGATDGHGNISLPSTIVESVLGDNKVLFPIPIVIENNQFLVNIENAAIPYGSIISEINGRSVDSILATVLIAASAFEIRNLERSFDILFLLKYGAINTFQIAYSLPNHSEIQYLKLDAINVESREQIYKNTVMPLHREQLTKTINTQFFEAENIFYIQLNSFTWRDEKVENEYDTFKKKFEDIFKTIQKQNVSNLIIDLRYNSGGNMIVPSLFYSFIAEDNFNEHIELIVPDFDFPESQHLVGVENRSLPTEALDAYLKNFKKGFTKNEDYYDVKVVNQKTNKANKRAYQGKVYLLVSGRTFSAAAYFAALFKSQNRGKIIGEPIGGTFRNITAGMQLVYELPNSELLVNMPIGLYKFSEDLDKAMPDANIGSDMILHADLFYEHYLNKKDAYLIETLGLISKANKD